MTGIPYHKFSNVFPADIKANGLREPITLYQGKILEGRNRYRACLRLKIEPQFEEFEGDDADAYAFVISKNISRRHLKPADKNKAAADLLRMKPEQSDRSIARQVGISHPTVAAVREEIESQSTGKSFQLSEPEQEVDATVQTGQLSEPKPEPKRIGRDGKARKQPAKKKAGRPEVADAPDELPSEPKVAEPVGEPATTTVATTGKPLSRKERREIMRVEIERLATRLVEVDPGSARKLYDILWEDDRYADALVEALSRVLGIDEENDEENDEKNDAEGNGTHPQASANQRKAEHAARAAVGDGSDAGDIPACLRRSL